MKIADYTGAGDYVFAQNLHGLEFRLLDDEIVEASELEHEVQGKWLRVKTDEFDDGHLSAVGELLGELRRLQAQPGDSFRITRCKKSGQKQTDPYEVNVEAIDPDQGRLS